LGDNAYDYEDAYGYGDDSYGWEDDYAMEYEPEYGWEDDYAMEYEPEYDWSYGYDEPEYVEEEYDSYEYPEYGYEMDYDWEPEYYEEEYEVYPSYDDEWGPTWNGPMQQYSVGEAPWGSDSAHVQTWDASHERQGQIAPSQEDIWGMNQWEW